MAGRLTHKSYVANMKGNSHRMRETKVWINSLKDQFLFLGGKNRNYILEWKLYIKYTYAKNKLKYIRNINKFLKIDSKIIYPQFKSCNFTIA